MRKIQKHRMSLPVCLRMDGRTADGRHHGVAAPEALGRLRPQPADVVRQAHLCVWVCGFVDT
jgi:hypothetical protein